jgi:hypothetical protein
MDILAWVDKPVLALLNQTGAPRATSERLAEEARWRGHLAATAHVRDVVDLDAFSRAWVQEIQLLERIRALLPAPLTPPMDGFIARAGRDARETFHASLRLLADTIAEAAADGEPLPRGQRAARSRRQGLERLGQRLQSAVRDASAELVRLQGLEGAGAARVRAQLEDVAAPGEPPNPWTAGVLGGLAGGALGGLAADIATGGLTFGAGTVIGAILGTMGLGGLSWGYQMLGGAAEPRVTWSDAFLDRQVRDALLRYLAVIHFGRGAGEYREREEPDFWRAAVDAAVEARRRELHELWREARGSDAAARAAARERLHASLESMAVDLLAEFYPGVGRIFVATPA